LYPDRADAFSVPCASSHGRPWSLDHRRSAPLWRLCARTEPLFHELRRASAHYFRFWTFPHYTLGLSSRQKRVFGNSYCENHISKSLAYVVDTPELTLGCQHRSVAVRDGFNRD